MIFRSQKHAVLSILIATALGGVVVADAAAQSRSSERRGNKESSKAEVLYPEATRVDPKGKALGEQEMALGLRTKVAA